MEKLSTYCSPCLPQININDNNNELIKKSILTQLSLHCRN